MLTEYPFWLGFTVSPVVHVVLGATIYGCFLGLKRLASVLQSL
jgi:hypothetical protein